MEEINIILLGIAFFLIALLITVFIYLVYSGLLYSVTVKAGPPPISGFTVAYKFLRGPYKNVGETFSEACSIAPELKTFGVFYDDPREVQSKLLIWRLGHETFINLAFHLVTLTHSILIGYKAQKTFSEFVEACELRSGVGCILAEGEQGTDPEHRAAFLKHGYHLFCFPAITSAVHTVFPFKNMMSLILANLRVYPALVTYLEEHKLCGHPFLEIYRGDTIHYMVPLARQDDFYLPETESKKSKAEVSDSADLDCDDEQMTQEESTEGKQGDCFQEKLTYGYSK